MYVLIECVISQYWFCPEISLQHFTKLLYWLVFLVSM